MVIAATCFCVCFTWRRVWREAGLSGYGWKSERAGLETAKDLFYCRRCGGNINVAKDRQHHIIRHRVTLVKGYKILPLQPL